MYFFVLHVSLVKCLVSGIPHLVTHLKDSGAVMYTHGNGSLQQEHTQPGEKTCQAESGGPRAGLHLGGARLRRAHFFLL